MSISPDASVEQDVPTQRRAEERSTARRVARELAAVREATERLGAEVTRLGDGAMREPSGLPGWTRAHVVTHLARNADALVNLMTWARTGVEHPMYASAADRDADIEEGSTRLATVLHEDLRAACERLVDASERLADAHWLAPVTGRATKTFPAASIPGFRLFEVWVHLVDLNVGFDFTDIPRAHLDDMVDTAIDRQANREDGPSVRLTVTMSGGERTWDLAGGGGDVHEVRGKPAEVIAWLTGRGDGATLRGDVPRLPKWG